MKKVSHQKNSTVLVSPHHPLFQRNIFSLYHAFLVFGILIVVLISSCKKDTTPGKNSVPFKAEFITTSVTTHPGDPIQTDHITGTGQGTPIGKSTFDAVVSFDITGPSPLKITGQQTITTANGDKIFSTIDAYSPDPDEDGNFYTIGSETITGGTGKYANAKGTLTFKASGSLNSPAGDNSFEGTISY
ncbi:MAG: hypothetical protein ABIW47_05230 [Ginsengibacter sp.]|jgi:hypothetical protein